MGKKCFFSECSNQEGFKFDTCEYCGNAYCGEHINWKNHFCKKRNSGLQKDLENAEEQVKNREEFMKSKLNLFSVRTFGMALNETIIEGLKKKIGFYKKELKRSKK